MATRYPNYYLPEGFGCRLLLATTTLLHALLQREYTRGVLISILIYVINETRIYTY